MSNHRDVSKKKVGNVHCSGGRGGHREQRGGGEEKEAGSEIGEHINSAIGKKGKNQVKPGRKKRKVC